MRVFLMGCGVSYCVLAYVMIFFGELHVDEGYYHLIAHLTSAGKMPYRDYFYVQTPLYPYVYGFVFRILGSGFEAARGFSAVLGLSSLLLAARIARRREGVRGAAAAAGLIVCQPFTIYYLTIVKLYALAALALVLAVLFLDAESKPERRYPAAAFWLAVATGIRLTVAPALGAVVILALIRTRRLKPAVLAALTAALTLAAIIIPFYLAAGDTITYDLVRYHFQKEAFSIARQVLHKLDTCFHLAKLYFLMGCLALASVAFRWLSRKNNPGDIDPVPLSSRDSAWVLSVVALVHFASQAPYVYRYLAMLVPAVAAILGAEIVRLERFMNRSGRKMQPGWVFGMACVMTLAGRGGEDLGDLTGGGAMMYLKSVSAQMEMMTSPEKPILTFNNSIAVEAGREVMRGDEMNVLSYHPDWTEQRCIQYAVLNADMLERQINRERFGAILVTEYSFLGNFPTFYNPGETGARPRIMSAVEMHYIRIGTFPGFGYLGEDAHLYIPRHRPGAGHHGKDSEDDSAGDSGPDSTRFDGTGDKQ